jgi:hypothetical protein
VQIGLRMERGRAAQQHRDTRAGKKTPAQAIVPYICGHHTFMLA